MKLVWKGRTWEPRALEHAKVPVSPIATSTDGRADTRAGVQILEQVGDRPDNRLIHGDVLEVAAALHRDGSAGKAELVYVDPPYFSQTDYTHEARLDGRADGRVRRTAAYRDRWGGAGGAGAGGGEDAGVAAYLDMLAPRLEALASLLAPEGSLWVQLDWRAAYLARVILDEIFGRGGFKNEIVWRRAPNLGRQAASGQFGRTLDTILVYGGPAARIVPPTRLEPIPDSAVRRDDEGRPFTTAPRGDYTDASVAKLEAEGRIHRTASGKVYVKYFLVEDSDGRLCRERRVDALWTDVAPLRHAQPSERTGYPTQKPLSLLERIVACATRPGGLVVDLFGGSGTTGEAAHRLGRRFVIGDAASLAIATARARLLRGGASLSVERCAGANVDGRDGANAKVRVDVVPAPEGMTEVRLREPREPLAWAIANANANENANDEGNDVFRPVWHAERRPGAKATPAATVARVPASERLRVRVYLDDGAVIEETVAGESRTRTRTSASTSTSTRAKTRTKTKTKTKTKKESCL